MAIENLSTREGMPNSKGVGFVNLVAGKQSDIAVTRHPKAVATIAEWTAETGFDAVIWTALDSNFHKPKAAGQPFAVDAAKSYLETLDRVSFARALHYIWNAPTQVQTPLRTSINANWPERQDPR
jgi:hypothetical protein